MPAVSRHDQRPSIGPPTLLPTRMVQPRSKVRNFFSCRILVTLVDGKQHTSATARSGHRETATFCKQYKRRLSSVNHRSSASSSSPPVCGSTKGRPVASSRNLHRHFMTSMGGNGAFSSHTGLSESLGDDPLQGTFSISSIALSRDRPSRK